MRLQILSDLHLEFSRDIALSIAPEADVLIVAGDICAGTDKGFAWVRDQAEQAGRADLPIVAVAGNHEFYGRNWQAERRAAARAAPDFGIAWLDDDVAEIDGVRFVGATLWTDYELYGADLRADAQEVAGRSMNDHRLIGQGDDPLSMTSFSPYHARDAHLVSRGFIEDRLAEPFAGPTVVVTHHGPHERSVAPKFRETILTAAFASDLSTTIAAHQPALWVHGHTHVSFDYHVGRTRVICNPHGYPGENRRFDPTLVVSV